MEEGQDVEVSFFAKSSGMQAARGSLGPASSLIQYHVILLQFNHKVDVVLADLNDDGSTGTEMALTP